MLNLNKTQPSDVSSLPFAGKTLSLILAGSVLLASSLFSQPSEAAKPRGDRGMERGGGDNGMFEAPMSDVALVMPDQSWSFVIDRYPRVTVHGRRAEPGRAHAGA